MAILLFTKLLQTDLHVDFIWLKLQASLSILINHKKIMVVGEEVDEKNDFFIPLQIVFRLDGTIDIKGTFG